MKASACTCQRHHDLEPNIATKSCCKHTYEADDEGGAGRETGAAQKERGKSADESAENEKNDDDMAVLRGYNVERP